MLLCFETKVYAKTCFTLNFSCFQLLFTLRNFLLPDAQLLESRWQALPLVSSLSHKKSNPRSRLCEEARLGYDKVHALKPRHLVSDDLLWSHQSSRRSQATSVTAEVLKTSTSEITVLSPSSPFSLGEAARGWPLFHASVAPSCHHWDLSRDTAVPQLMHGGLVQGGHTAAASLSGHCSHSPEETMQEEDGCIGWCVTKPLSNQLPPALPGVHSHRRLRTHANSWYRQRLWSPS
jgi:hypothetical protein